MLPMQKDNSFDYNLSATDNVATNIHPICQPISSGQVFPIGNTTIVLLAKDNSNNTAKASFVVVIADRTPQGYKYQITIL